MRPRPVREKPWGLVFVQSGMTRTHTTIVLLSSFALLLGACDETPTPKPRPAASTPEADTSAADELTEERAQDSDGTSSGGEEREWVEEEGSKSLLGRSRDKARDLANEIQGGTAPEEGLAVTIEEDEYASASGIRWDMPGDWRMAVPAQGRFAEMLIQNPLGNASVSFSRETKTVRDLTRQLEAEIVDPMGGRSRARTTNETILGHPVTFAELTGTYLDPGSKGSANERVFYAMRAAIYDLGEERVLVKMWGPESTIERAARDFETMIRGASND